jgi:hypothetical protein
MPDNDRKAEKVDNNPGGKEDRSVREGMSEEKKNSFPRLTEKDRQFDNQPEFIETEPNKKPDENEV